MAHHDTQHPLITALPPHTDYYSYLTIVEANLDLDSLPLLQEVLQDETLTINIGWDLVHLLLPLLPESEPCLLTIARLGNPREVLLKASECLRLISFDDDDKDDRQDESDDDNANEETVADKTSTKSQAQRQFTLLLSMLVTLHARIKTKYPSRFLATTLSAVISTLQDAVLSCNYSLIPDTLNFLHKLDNTNISGSSNAADPEAASTGPSAEDLSISAKLKQAFVTSLAEVFIGSPLLQQEHAGIALSDRVQEKLTPQKLVPHRQTVSDLFKKDTELAARLSCAEQLSQAARSVSLTVDHFQQTALKEDGPSENETPEDLEDDDKPPDRPEDIPLSKAGCIYFLAYNACQQILFDTSSQEELNLSIFPEHHLLLQALGNPSDLEFTISSFSGLIDCLLTLGILAVNNDNIGEPKTNEDFNRYLQVTSILSANVPSSSLRFHAHYLTATVLRSHPDENARLGFIKDTFENCPYENVKATAVGWVKGEILEATMGGNRPSLFSSPVCLDLLGEHLFPDLSTDFARPDISNNWQHLQLRLSFYLASLNFYYMLLSAKTVHEPLAIKSFHTSHDLGGSFLGPLKAASKKLQASLQSGQLKDEEGQAGAGAGLTDLMLLDATLERVDGAVVALNKE